MTKLCRGLLVLGAGVCLALVPVDTSLTPTTAACGSCAPNSATTCLIGAIRVEAHCDADAPPPPNGCPEV